MPFEHDLLSVDAASLAALSPIIHLLTGATQEVETQNYGKVVLSRAIYDKWKAVGVGMLGDPIGSSFRFAGGHSAAYFERGMIVERAGGGVFEVHGLIYLRYRDQQDISGWMGLPSSDEGDAPNGRVSHFDNADIYWRSGAGAAFEVHGAIRDRYAALGGAGGWVGYPLTNELQVLRGGQEIGRLSRFEGAVIYWSPATGAWEVHGDIRRRYEEVYGGPAGELGFPVSNEETTPQGSGRYSDFQNGVMLWQGNYDTMRVFRGLKLYLDRFDSKGSDGFLGGGQDVYMILNVTNNAGYNYSERIPDSGDSGSSGPLQKTLPSFGVPRGNWQIRVKIDGWDSDSGFIRGWVGDDDDLLGTVDQTYTIDNHFGLNDTGEHWVGDFMLAYAMQEDVPYNTLQFRQNCFWNFKNFNTPRLSKRQYAETFSDVDQDESAVWHPFNALYYEVAYKGAASKGNCFGMGLLSIFSQVGRSIYNEPVNRFGLDDAMKNEVNLKHGVQLGAPFIDFYAGKFLLGQTRDPVRAFRESRDQFMRGDYPLLCITRDMFGAGAHVVRPYRWDDSVTPWQIYVANPNNPAPSFGDTDVFNIISVDPNANSFTLGTGDKAYNGAAWSGGRMVSVPFSVVCDTPRTPFWEVFALLAAATIIILGDGAQTKQITDAQGRTFYNDLGGRTPKAWSDIREDRGRIPKMSRVPLLGRGHWGDVIGQIGGVRFLTPSEPEIYYLRHAIASRGPQQDAPDVVLGNSGRLDRVRAHLPLNPLLLNDELKHEIVGTGDSYRWGWRSPLLSLTLEADLPAAQLDTVQLSNLQSAWPTVNVQPHAAKALKLTLTGFAAPTGQWRNFALQIAEATQPVQLSLDQAAGSVSVTSAAPLTLDLQVSVPDGAPVLTRQGVQLEAGQLARLAPEKWEAPDLAASPVKLSVFDAQTMKLLTERML
ncbi:hypothetical protein Dxin01_01518 [Deinococcus xinjiangensis]|uniref:LGFP repeat-containing protein n=1 Tax=Deinococcus xinjiangensis TaxID=457454 RepID=A0ABP9V938_9DEIO